MNCSHWIVPPPGSECDFHAMVMGIAIALALIFVPAMIGALWMILRGQDKE